MLLFHTFKRLLAEFCTFWRICMHILRTLHCIISNCDYKDTIWQFLIFYSFLPLLHKLIFKELLHSLFYSSISSISNLYYRLERLLEFWRFVANLLLHLLLPKRNYPKTCQKSQLVNNFYFQTQLIKIPTYCDVAVVRFHISPAFFFQSGVFKKNLYG